MEAMEYVRVPGCLIEIIASYLDDREIVMETSTSPVSRMISSVVLPDSVLWLTLWNLAFNDILKIAPPPGGEAICYADDTLVVCSGEADRVGWTA